MSTILKANRATRAKGLAKASLVLATLITGLSMVQAHDGHKRPMCPPYHSEYWGHFPTCWRPWPAGWHEQCCTVHAEPLPAPRVVAPAPAPMPEKAPMPKPMPELSKKAPPAPAPAQNWTNATIIMDPPPSESPGEIIKTSNRNTR